MALRSCKECGQQVSSDAKTCPHGGKKVASSTAAIGCLIVIGVLCSCSASPSGSTGQPSATPSEAKQPIASSQTAPAAAEEFSAGEKFAMNLERKYQQHGLDIGVRYSNPTHELRLSSDEFRDVEARSAVVGALQKDRKTLCNLGIWYIKVGYSKGWLSSDVASSTSLGCPAAVAQSQALRNEFAAKMGGGQVGSMSAEGTTLIWVTEFADDPAARQQMTDMMNRDQFCSRGFTRIVFRWKTHSHAVAVCQ